MAVNPMQRKARQSFILGMFVMLVIAAIVVALLFMQITKMRDAETATAAGSKTVSVFGGITSNESERISFFSLLIIFININSFLSFQT